MKMIQNEVLDDKATKNIQSGIQTGSSRVGGQITPPECTSHNPMTPE